MREQPFLPRRHSIRLPSFDYSQPASYFLTICTEDNKLLFGKVVNGTMQLNKLGEIVDACWREIPDHSTTPVHLGAYNAMPNHLHGIVILGNSAQGIANGQRDAKHLCRARHAVPLRNLGRLISDCRDAFKTQTQTANCNHMRRMPQIAIKRLKSFRI